MPTYRLLNNNKNKKPLAQVAPIRRRRVTLTRRLIIHVSGQTRRSAYFYKYNIFESVKSFFYLFFFLLTFRLVTSVWITTYLPTFTQ